MMETALAAMNALVALLNMCAWSQSGSITDIVAALAWLGSAVYWVTRGKVEE